MAGIVDYLMVGWPVCGGLHYRLASKVVCEVILEHRPADEVRPALIAALREAGLNPLN
jgi:hypothetical protein